MKTNKDIERIIENIESHKQNIKWLINKLNQDLEKEDYDYWFDSLCFWVTALKDSQRDLKIELEFQENERNKENWDKE